MANIELENGLELLEVARRSELVQALASANIYASTALGLASGASYFSVPSAEVDEYLTLYHVVAGAAVVVDTYPNVVGLNNARDAAEAFATNVLTVAQEVSADRMASQQAALDAGNAAQLKVDALSQSMAASGGSALVGAKKPFTGAKDQTQYDINKIKISVSDFVGADPTGVALQDACFVSAANENAGPVFVPAGTWRVSSPLALPYKAQYFGPGVIKYDNAEHIRRGGSAGVGVAENYTLFYEYSNTADVSVQFNGVTQAITWVDAFTVNAPASISTDTVRINVANGLQRLGAVPVMVRSFNSIDVLTPGLAPNSPAAPASPVGWCNWYQGTGVPIALTTGVNNTFGGARAGRSITSGLNNTGFGFQTLYRATGSSNTAIGSIAGEWITTGIENALVGASAGCKIKTGSQNTVLGALAFGEPQASTACVAVGYRAMGNGGLNNPTECTVVGAYAGDFAWGNKNTLLGYRAGCGPNAGSDGTENVFVGFFSGRNQEGADYNSALGVSSLYALTSGQYNVAFGHGAGGALTAGSSITALGYRSFALSTAGQNVGVGYQTGALNTTGTGLVAVGYNALGQNVSGINSTAAGHEALAVSTGDENTGFGYNAGTSVTIGIRNVLIGSRAGRLTTTGASVVAVGRDAAYNNTTGSNIVAVGGDALKLDQAGAAMTNFSNVIGLGFGSAVSGSNQLQLGGSAVTPYAYVALQIRSDARDKINPRKLSKVVEFMRSINWVEYQNNFREDYFDEVERSRTVSEIYETSFVDSDGKAITATRDVVELYMERVPVENDGSRAGKRFRPGAYAQEIEALCTELEIDWAGLQHHAINGGCDVYTLAYELFIPYMGVAIQHVLDKQDDLERRLEALEAKQ